MHQSLLPFAVASALAASGTAQHIIKSMTGDQPGANFGRTLAAVADLDGDGKPDLVVGEPQRDFGGLSDAGAAAIVRTGAWVLGNRTFGSAVGGRLGGSVAGLGDVDNDNVPDWACGGPDALTGISTVRIVSGATNFVLHQLTGEVFSGFGAGICSIGDRNDDGFADFAIGAPNNTTLTPNGTVRFYSGADGGLLATLAGASGTDFGKSLATLGDVTGDGQPEIAIGEPGADANGTDSGRVRTKNPRDGVPGSYVWQSSLQFATGHNAGLAVARLDDIDGDGRAEVLVAGDGNRVYAVSGTTGQVLFGVDNPEFGATPSVAGIGDWNGDGQPDFAVGAPTANFGSGRVFVYAATGTHALLGTIQGTGSSAFGSAVVGLGDLDGDGRVELAVGAPTHISAGIVVGRVTVHSFDILPELITFGQGCPGQNGTPSLYFAGTPNLGQSIDMHCGNLLANGIGMLIFGFSDTATGAIPLPMPLAVIGLPSCTLYASLDLLEPFATPGTTLMTRTLALPNVPSLATWQVFVQALQFDNAATGGISMSNAGSVYVGNL